MFRWLYERHGWVYSWAVIVIVALVVLFTPWGWALFWEFFGTYWTGETPGP